MDLTHFDRVLKEECGLDPAKLLVVGVSGGPDSLCLMDSLFRLGYRLLVVHFDHRLRPESVVDAQMVLQEAEKRSLPFILGSMDVAELAGREKLSIEEAARIARYRFLFQAASEHQAQAVAVGHTADDQVETVLMHFLRGSGLSGLKGMTWTVILPLWNNSIPLVRPLLSCWREDTERYCRERNLRPVIDATNADVSYFRNRLRHELIPYLQQYNPQVKEVIQRNALALAGDYEVLEELKKRVWSECLVEQEKGHIILRLALVRRQPTGLQRWIVRQAIGTLRPGLRDIDFDTVLRAVEFIHNPARSKSIDLAQHISIFCDGTELWFLDQRVLLRRSDWLRLDQQEPLELLVPGRVTLSAEWVIEAEYYREPFDYLAALRSDPYQALVDAGSISLPLIVHKTYPGARFEPLGMPGKRMKMSDFWVNVGLSRMARADWPLVSSLGVIIWVPGYRPAHAVRITDETKLAIHLRVRKEKLNE